MTENKSSDTPRKDDHERQQVNDFLNAPSGQWILRILIVMAVFFLIRALFF